jgi:hypothetical protein
MSKNLFARWSFTILRNLKAQYHHAKLIIIATTILNNIAMKFGEVETGAPDNDVMRLLREVVMRMEDPLEVP